MRGLCLHDTKRDSGGLNIEGLGECAFQSTLHSLS
jgi:hypothetical protein